MNLTDGLKSLPFQRWFYFWEKPKVRESQIWAVAGPESPGWFDVLPKNSAWDVIHERAHCHDEAADHQLLIAAAFWMIWIVSVEECSSLLQNVMQICCVLTHFECDSHRAHMFTQWGLLPPLTSSVKSSLFVHAHSSPLSLASRLHQCPANHFRYTTKG